jgi:2-polyprenyl-3-methyl-5-hydroxy-6-metoxy-1,4-benzoquinol methylase
MSQSIKPVRGGNHYCGTWAGEHHRLLLWRAYGYIFQPNRRILDVGCTGATMQHLQQLGVVTGIDLPRKPFSSATNAAKNVQQWTPP